MTGLVGRYFILKKAKHFEEVRKEVELISASLTDSAKHEQREESAKYIEAYAERLVSGTPLKDFGFPVNRLQYDDVTKDGIAAILRGLASSVRAGLPIEPDWPQGLPGEEKQTFKYLVDPRTISFSGQGAKLW